MNVDDAFVRAALYETCKKSTILANINLENADIQTLRNFVNKLNSMTFQEMPILMSKMAVKYGVTFLRDKIPILKDYVNPDNLIVQIEDDELAFLLNKESSGTVKSNIYMIVLRNIVLSILGVSIENLRNTILQAHKQKPSEKKQTDTRAAKIQVLSVSETTANGFPKQPNVYSNGFMPVRKLSSDEQNVSSNLMDSPSDLVQPDAATVPTTNITTTPQPSSHFQSIELEDLNQSPLLQTSVQSSAKPRSIQSAEPRSIQSAEPRSIQSAEPQSVVPSPQSTHLFAKTNIQPVALPSLPNVHQPSLSNAVHQHVLPLTPLAPPPTPESLSSELSSTLSDEEFIGESTRQHRNDEQIKTSAEIEVNKFLEKQREHLNNTRNSDDVVMSIGEPIEQIINSNTMTNEKPIHTIVDNLKSVNLNIENKTAPLRVDNMLVDNFKSINPNAFLDIISMQVNKTRSLSPISTSSQQSPSIHDETEASSHLPPRPPSEIILLDHNRTNASIKRPRYEDDDDDHDHLKPKRMKLSQYEINTDDAADDDDDDDDDNNDNNNIRTDNVNNDNANDDNRAADEEVSFINKHVLNKVMLNNTFDKNDDDDDDDDIIINTNTDDEY